MTGAQRERIEKLKKKHRGLTVDGETPDREVMVSWPREGELSEPGERTHALVTVNGVVEHDPASR